MRDRFVLRGKNLLGRLGCTAQHRLVDVYAMCFAGIDKNPVIQRIHGPGMGLAVARGDKGHRLQGLGIVDIEALGIAFKGVHQVIGWIVGHLINSRTRRQVCQHLNRLRKKYEIKPTCSPDLSKNEPGYSR